MTRGREVGITAALVEDDSEEEAVDVAEIILDCGVKAVAESVPVGLIELVGASETVGLLLVVAGAVVKFPAGVTSGVTCDESDVGDGGTVAVLLFPVSGGFVGVLVGVLLYVGVTVLLSVGVTVFVSVGVTVLEVELGGKVFESVGVIVLVFESGGVMVGVTVGVTVGVIVGVTVGVEGDTVGEFSETKELKSDVTSAGFE